MLGRQLQRMRKVQSMLYMIIFITSPKLSYCHQSPAQFTCKLGQASKNWIRCSQSDLFMEDLGIESGCFCCLLGQSASDLRSWHFDEETRDVKFEPVKAM